MIKLRQLRRSVACAAKGLVTVFREEQNFRIQIVVSAAVIVAMVAFGVRAMEAVALILVMMFVLVLELLNSIFERLADMLKPRMHHYVGHIKDLMAAAVLVSSVAAAVIGILIFWPYVQEFWL